MNQITPQIARDTEDGRTIFKMVPNTQMQAEVILASMAPGCPQITTMRLRYPRIIHSEVMTHRVFSRNARSSRAVPVKTMIREIRDTPFVPWHWGQNRPGMQAGESFTKGEIRDMQAAWFNASTEAVMKAELLMSWGVHKQIPNRLLEPFMWIDTLITSTDWVNFLWLRDHKDAEPHLQDLARLVSQALDDCEVQNLVPGYWHLPYLKLEDYKLQGRWTHFEEQFEFLQKISAARCARISYAPFDGDASYERELERYDSLVSSDRVHASPLEHQATPDSWYIADDMGSGYWNTGEDFWGNLRGWVQFRKMIPNEAVW